MPVGNCGSGSPAGAEQTGQAKITNPARHIEIEDSGVFRDFMRADGILGRRRARRGRGDPAAGRLRCRDLDGRADGCLRGGGISLAGRREGGDPRGGAGAANAVPRRLPRPSDARRCAWRPGRDHGRGEVGILEVELTEDGWDPLPKPRLPPARGNELPEAMTLACTRSVRHVVQSFRVPACPAAARCALTRALRLAVSMPVAAIARGSPAVGPE